jgi:2-keto-4-pentenoate hydratase
VAFIELPDPLTSPELAPTAAMLAATNVAARLGVMGQRLPVLPTQEFADALGNQDFILTDGTGQELVRAKGTAMLGHPLNVTAWLVQDLSAAGVRLKAGDLLSLGTVSPSVPTKAGQTIHQRCEGLPGGTIGATVRFT